MGGTYCHFSPLVIAMSLPASWMLVSRSKSSLSPVWFLHVLWYNFYLHQYGPTIRLLKIITCFENNLCCLGLTMGIHWPMTQQAVNHSRK